MLHQYQIDYIGYILKCAEFRLEFSNWFEDTVDTLDDEGIEAIMTTVDNFWIYILNQHVKTME